MKTLSKEIFQEELKKQSENITNLISGNFKLTMEEIHGLKNEINDLRKSLRKEKLDSHIQEIYEYQIDPKYVLHKLTELED